MFSNNNELNLNEKYLSHIPAVKTLIAFGYELLSQEELKKKRSNSQNILLENILIEKILKINNNAQHNFDFNEDDAEKAIRQLRDIENCGLIKTNEKIYDLLTLGANIKKDSKSYDLKFIDWQNLQNNTYHIAFEVPVESKIRRGSIRICDIVLFVNGIPFVVIENKSPTESLDQAISQHIRNQRSDEIPQLFYYAQILIAVNKNEAKYATIGSSKEHWSIWREEEEDNQNINIIRDLINTPLPEDIKDVLYTGAFVSCRKQGLAGIIEPTEQDKALYALCRPERLFDLVANFCVFDNSVRKIARHHQFFATYAFIKRVEQRNNTREGGVIWHTQGTGKSLTMILFAKFLLKFTNIVNPRIIIITDRIELDKQIASTFKACGFEARRADSSKDLIQLLKGNTSVITAVIHKFRVDLDNIFQNSDFNIFVFVDECHRTQYGDFANNMRAILPNACYIGFTGTPIFNEYKNTIKKFGEPIHEYTIKDALKDNMIVPLYYEGRVIRQQLKNPSELDRSFDKITNILDKKEKANLKRKSSSSRTLSTTKETIYAKASDISAHYFETFKGTGLKGMLIAPSRSIANQYKEILDKIGQVSSEVVISSFDDRENHENIENDNKKDKFLNGMREKYRPTFNHITTEKFKNAGDPEILIVVSKLLTGFDAPRIAVIYICKILKEHNLLQAIARANRLFREEEKVKEYGYIIDYEELSEEMKLARQTYETKNISNFNILGLKKLDEEDLQGTIFFVDDKIKELISLLQEIKNIFINVPNNLDFEQLEQYLADKTIRNNFYFLLEKFNRLMSIVASSHKLCEKIEQLSELKQELKRFNKLKEIVKRRYREKVDRKIYTNQIARLLDEHIAVSHIIKTELVNIFDDVAFENFIERIDITDLEKTNQINAQIKDAINIYNRIDPALFQKFSELINNTIIQHYNKRLSDSNFLSRAKEIRAELKNDALSKLENNKTLIDFYEKLYSFLQDKTNQNQRENAIKIARDTYNIIKQKTIVHWTRNTKTINEMRNSLDDYFHDDVKKGMKIDFDTENLNEIVDSLIDIAKEHEAK
ncbi:MAG: hypothetical protein RLZZ81_1152 [Pseudomonadota bacterium]|jgi:type I restriction enzyme R subunit